MCVQPEAPTLLNTAECEVVETMHENRDEDGCDEDAAVSMHT